MPTDKPEGARNTRAGSKQQTTKWPFWLLSGLVLLALGGFTYVLISQWLAGQSDQPTSSGTQTTGLTPDEDSNQPISILPDTPEGVTIIEKQPELPASDNALLNGTPIPGTAAPIAQGAEVASGFAMDLGNADAFLELSQRFASIAETNGPDNFVRLEPRAVLRETVTGLEARLLVGPFETNEAASEACSVLILDAEITCSVAPFEGELIPRE